MKIAAFAVLAALAAAPAGAQTYDAAKSQQRLNAFQLQIQSDQLQQLQRRNAVGLSQTDPVIQMQAAQRQQSIQQQIDQTTALGQQMQAPRAAPAAISARVQQNGDQIQHLQQAPPIPPGG